MTRHLTVAVTVTLTLLFAVAGCRSKKTSADLINDNLDRLSSCYLVYWTEHGFRGPEDEQQFKSYLREDRVAQKRLKRMGISSDQIDSMFTSDRDGEPFKVKYGVTGYFDHAIVFESKGVDGRRMIALMNPIEADEKTYDGYWSGDIKPRSLEMQMGSGMDEKAAAESAVEN